MSFWDLSDGNKTESADSFELVENMEPIPNDTTCIAAVEEAGWDNYADDHIIKIKWRILEPQDYGNRVVFQKIKVFGTAQDKDPKATSDKAKRMLAAIDANAGGKLMKLGKEPTDESLMSALMGKSMAIKVMEWKIPADQSSDGTERKGNWIAAVAPGKSNKKPAAKPKPAPESVEEEEDYDLPF